MQTSSLGEKLLQAKQDCRSQTERANDLENKGTELKEKVQELEQKIINTEKEHALKSKETTDATSQTDDNQVRSQYCGALAPNECLKRFKHRLKNRVAKDSKITKDRKTSAINTVKFR